MMFRHDDHRCVLLEPTGQHTSRVSQEYQEGQFTSLGSARSVGTALLRPTDCLDPSWPVAGILSAQGQAQQSAKPSFGSLPGGQNQQAVVVCPKAHKGMQEPSLNICTRRSVTKHSI